MRHNMNQPVKPRQTLILFESSSRTEDTGKYTYDLQLPLQQIEMFLPAATQAVKAFEFR